MCTSCISVFLAQLIGIYLFIVSLAMLVHQQRYKKVMTDFLANPALISLSGGLGVIIGLLIVLCHNIWISDWPVLVTLIGWFILLQGIARIFFTGRFIKAMKDIMTKSCYLIWCWVWLLLGLYLIWVGFGSNGYMH